MSTKSLQDGVLKGQILVSVSDKKTSSRSIFNTIEYTNYNSFMSAMHRLTRYGYLHREGRGKCGKHPYTYSLTKKGVLHAQNPLLNLQHRNAFVQKLAMEFMENTEQFQQAVAEYARIHGAGTGGAGGFGGTMPTTNIVPERPKPQSPTIKRNADGKPHWLKLQETRERRRNIAYRYYDEARYLDERFFKVWGKTWTVYKFDVNKKTGVIGHYEVLSNDQS